MNLARTQIRAPFDGALGARRVSPGDWVDSDVELVQIDAVERLQLQFSLPEQQIALALAETAIDLDPGLGLR